MKRLTAVVLASSLIIASCPNISVAAGLISPSVAKDVLGGRMVANITMHLDALAPLLPNPGQEIEPNLVSTHMIQNGMGDALHQLSSNLLLESLIDPALAERAVDALGSDQEEKSSLRRMVVIANGLQKAPAESWRGEQSRLAGLRKLLAHKSDPVAVASALLTLFDGRTMPSGKASQIPTASDNPPTGPQKFQAGAKNDSMADAAAKRILSASLTKGLPESEIGEALQSSRGSDAPAANLSSCS